MISPVMSMVFMSLWIIGIVFDGLIWILTLVTLSGYNKCSYGTSCQFSNVNDTCFLAVDNTTTILDKMTASPTALHACFTNSTITCYYSKVADSRGDVLGNYYKSSCFDNYNNFMSQIVAFTSPPIVSFIFFPILAYLLFICEYDCCRKKGSTNPV
uniref:Uncharacterized protein n=1 Tax=viral metagenome TaxID=1070528 RepID=A0A6C0JU09_9ZZZZ